VFGKLYGWQGYKDQRCRFENYIKIELQTLLLSCVHTLAMDVVLADLKGVCTWTGHKCTLMPVAERVVYACAICQYR